MSEETSRADVGPFPGKLGPYTARAVERMKQGKPGDAIGREEMTQVVGRDCGVAGKGCAAVYSATLIIERDHGMVWRLDSARGAWVCLGGAGIVAVERASISAVRRRARRNHRVHAAVDRAELGDEDRVQHDLNAAQSGMALLATSTPFRRRLAAADTNRLTEPDPAKLIELMRGKQQSPAPSP